MNTSRFTQKTMEALQSAQSLAIEYQNQALEPQHLLAALAGQENGLIPQLLQKLLLSLDVFLCDDVKDHGLAIVFHD